MAIRKVDGVELVTVLLKEGRAKVQLKPGNTVRLSALRERIEKNGFTPKEAIVVAAGELRIIGGQRTFAVSGTNEVFIADTGAAQGAAERTPIVVNGTVPVLQNGTSERIQITKVQPADRKTP